MTIPPSRACLVGGVVRPVHRITLTRVEDKLGINFDVMHGQFMMSGVGVKK